MLDNAATRLPIRPIHR